MTAAHDLPLAVQWHEGMLLAPQHFQQATARQEALLAYHASLVAPFHWGVRHLKIDPVQLVDGTFRVLELEAVLPDGLAVSRLDGDDELTLDLVPLAEEMRQKEVPVHLAVTAQRGQLPSVSGELARYDSLPGQPVADANTGGGELRIPRLRPRLRLIAGDEVPEKFTSFPLARLRYANESFAGTDYLPPMLRVPVGSPLGEVCQAIAQRLREKAVFLAEQARSPALASRVPQLLEVRQRVQSLVAALPPFEAVLATGVSHPYPLYVALCSLVGQVAAVGYGLIPPVLEPYDHQDARAAFLQAQAFLFRALDEGVNELFTGYPLAEQDGTFSLEFDPAWGDSELFLGVRARDGESVDATATWTEQALVGSQSRMPALRTKRIRGAEHRRVQGDVELVPARGVTLFTLACDPQFIVAGERLEILNLDDALRRNRPAEIVLYVRNEGSGS